MGISRDRILYQDDHLLAVNKLAGELVVAAEGQGKLPLFDFLHKDFPGLRVLHRLDHGTSGVVVFAKTKEASEAIRLSKFAGWRKTYRALAAGYVERKVGTIERALAARTKDLKVPAVTHYRVLHAFPEASDLEVVIETGRKHQIRQHLAMIGHPLLLDQEYGDRSKDRAFSRHLPYKKFFLHAWKLSFIHPVTKAPVSITAPLPDVYQKVLGQLRGE